LLLPSKNFVESLLTAAIQLRNCEKIDNEQGIKPKQKETSQSRGDERQQLTEYNRQQATDHDPGAQTTQATLK